MPGPAAGPRARTARPTARHRRDTDLRSTRREEHCREPEPDPSAALRRGALRRAQARLDAAYKQIGAQIRVPGFRPGKVPARIIDQRVGRGAVLAQAMDEVVPRKYVEAAREHECRALGQPDIDVTETSRRVRDEPLSFTAEVDIRPEITLPELDGIAADRRRRRGHRRGRPEQLDALRDRFGTLTGVDRPVQTGDYVSLDLTATVDGERVEGGRPRASRTRSAPAISIDGLDEAIVGASAGDTVDVHRAPCSRASTPARTPRSRRR